MTLETYLFGTAISTILCFIAWILIIMNIDPTNTNMAGISLFYLSLFFCLTGLFSFIGYFFRRKVAQNKVEFTQVGISFRQGATLSFAFVGMLFLQSINAFNFVNASLLVSGIILLEFYFMSRR